MNNLDQQALMDLRDRVEEEVMAHRRTKATQPFFDVILDRVRDLFGAGMSSAENAVGEPVDRVQLLNSYRKRTMALEALLEAIS